MRIAFAGEALIDFTAAGGLSFQGREGGALANSAVAAARLGQPVGFITQLSKDLFGDRLLRHLQENGVDTRFVLRSEAPSALAFVERVGAVNRYAFYIRETAGTLWAPPHLPVLPDSCWLYFGSIALLHEPAADRIAELAEAERGRRVVMFDPNVRPSLIADAADYRHRCGRWLRACDLLKLSDEDAALLSPGVDAEQAAEAYLAQGPYAVIMTHGALGATLYRVSHAPVRVSPPPVRVADTIGAGDTFGAALTVALLERGVKRPEQLASVSEADWHGALSFAAAAAALNCTREGADPPHRSELDAHLREARLASGSVNLAK